VKKIFLYIFAILVLTNCETNNENTDENSSILVEEYGQLVWQDEFKNMGSPDSTFWKYDTYGNEYGWGNNEEQHFTKSNKRNAWVDNGKLSITAHMEKMGNKEYTSARLVSKKEWKYGRIEVRAKLPSGTGIWPAIWMLGSNIDSVGWPECGEMDIMEYVGYEPDNVNATVHTSSGYGRTGDGSEMILKSCEEEFHNYGLIWTEKKLTFYIGSVENIIHIYSPAVKTTKTWPFDKPAYLILNVSVGGDWGGKKGVDNSIFPQTMEIDYVRVYKKTQIK